MTTFITTLTKLFKFHTDNLFTIQQQDDKLMSLNFYAPSMEDYDKLEKYMENRSKERIDKIKEKYDLIFFKYDIIGNQLDKIPISQIKTITLKDSGKEEFYKNKRINEDLIRNLIKKYYSYNNNTKWYTYLTKGIKFYSFVDNNIYIIKEITDTDIILNKIIDRPNTGNSLFYFTFVQKPINFNDKKDHWFIAPAFINKYDIENSEQKKKFIEMRESNKTNLNNFKNPNLFSQIINLSSYTNNIINVSQNNLNYLLPNIVKNNDYFNFIFRNNNKNTFKIILPENNKFKKKIIDNALIIYKDKPELSDVYCKWKNETQIISTINRNIKGGIIIINNHEYYINQTQNIIELQEIKIRVISNTIHGSNNEVKTNKNNVRCILVKGNSYKWYIYC